MARAKPKERKNLSVETKIVVLTEAGYRCAVPTCRNILALDIHHLWEVSVGGGDGPENLIALCPYCHGLHHRGTIKAESLYAYKALLVALTGAFDVEAVDRLLFLAGCKKDFLVVSGDGVLQFSRLIGAGLATAELKSNNNWLIVTYTINVSAKGRQLISAWKSGKRNELQVALGGSTPTKKRKKAT